MARVYVHIPFKVADGDHPVNETLDLPRNTDEEKANYDRLIDYGIVGKDPLETTSTSSGESQS